MDATWMKKMTASVRRMTSRSDLPARRGDADSVVAPRSSIRLRSISLPIILSLLVNLFAWLLVLANVKPREEAVVLHYTTTFGIDRIGPWYLLAALPFAGAFVTVVNTWIAVRAARNDRQLAYLLLGAAIFIQCILLGAMILLTLENRR